MGTIVLYACLVVLLLTNVMGVVYSLRLLLLHTVKAVRRYGELLREIEPRPGARTDQPSIGADTSSQVARDAGFSDRERKTAPRVAKVWRDAAAE